MISDAISLSVDCRLEIGQTVEAAEPIDSHLSIALHLLCVVR